MPRKKSVSLAAENFIDSLDQITDFLEDVEAAGLGKEYTSWAFDYAIIRLYREFEGLVLDAIVGAINNDTRVLSERTGYNFPAHLTDEVCEYLVVGNGYFDFKGRDGLIKTLKRFVPDDHYLVVIMKKPIYKAGLEQLSALRNHAAHASEQSRRAALEATEQERIGSSGAWLKRQGRFGDIAASLRSLAQEISDNAPY